MLIAVSPKHFDRGILSEKIIKRNLDILKGIREETQREFMALPHCCLFMVLIV